MTNDYIVKYQYSRIVLPQTRASAEKGVTAMQLGQIAVVWMMHDQQQRLDSAKRYGHTVSRPSFVSRLGGKLRRIAYRAQLGPVAGRAAA